ncbi:hypothetical protein [Mycobacterium sp. 1245805.9]|uniref:hypothetical protein n=1 Tax=Mycobacterium sp. 1245805.9 TaxID=1856862 RepID=UPI0012EAE6EC|nr:hypothetical protein [Mycobacterium sp. 1245805.9]
MKTESSFPPLLARLTEDNAAELYLSVPKKWIPIGYPVKAEIMFTGEWDPVRSEDVAAVIEQLASSHRHDRDRFWLVSRNPDAPHVIVRSYADGPLESYVLGRRQWVALPDDDPLVGADRGDWDEMLLRETGVVRQCLEDEWHQRHASPNSHARRH